MILFNRPEFPLMPRYVYQFIGSLSEFSPSGKIKEGERSSMFKSLIAKCEPSGTYYTATMVNLNWLSILAEGESRAGKASDQAHTNTISGMEKQDKNQKSNLRPNHVQSSIRRPTCNVCVAVSPLVVQSIQILTFFDTQP